MFILQLIKEDSVTCLSVNSKYHSLVRRIHNESFQNSSNEDVQSLLDLLAGEGDPNPDSITFIEIDANIDGLDNVTELHWFFYDSY